MATGKKDTTREKNKTVKDKQNVKKSVPKTKTASAGSAKKKTYNAGKTAGKTAVKEPAVREYGAAGRRKELEVPDIGRKKGTPKYVEVVLMIIAAFCLILFLSNISGIGGILGRSVSRFFFGVFGAFNFAFPVIFLIVSLLLMANRGSLKAWKKVFSLLIIIISVCCFLELFYAEIDPARTLGDYYQFGRESHFGGGITGGAVIKLLYPVLGTIGTWIINFFLLLTGIILNTDFSFVDFAREEGRNAAENARLRNRYLREKRSQKKKRNREKRQIEYERKLEEDKQEEEGLVLQYRQPRRNTVVTGVSKDTTLDPAQPQASDIHEVIPGLKGRKTLSPPLAEYGISETDDDTPDLKPEGSAAAGEAAEKKERRKKTTAREMVDSVGEDAGSRQMDLDFTIERNGSYKKMNSGSPFSAAQAELSGEPQDEISMASVAEDGNRLIQSLEMKQLPPLKKTGPSKKDPEPEVTQEQTESDGDASAQELPKGRIKNPHSSKEEQEKNIESVAAQIQENEQAQKPAYVFPPIELLKLPEGSSGGSSDDDVRETAEKLQQTLHSFGVNVRITNVSCGPAVTRYELVPEQGVKVQKIVNLADDIKLNLAAADIRIEAPIPGKSAVGIEVPNKEKRPVYLRELLDSDEFKNASSNLSFGVGKDIAGKTVVADIAKMPHLLIAGATGAGKSVCINTLIMSILYKADPEDVKLIMIDPKVVELSVYNGIPHLFIPVVTDPKKASGALNWAVAEMTERYQIFATIGVRNLQEYNKKAEALKEYDSNGKLKKLPQIVIIVDELADLMMVAPGEVEDAICRLAQLARAAGLHLIIATQRPSVNVITGLIKANMPSRIAFAVTSNVDSRTILDMSGAEKLLGKGDMLFNPQGYPKPARVQGAFITDEEVNAIVDFLREHNSAEGRNEAMQEMISKVSMAASTAQTPDGQESELDPIFVKAGEFIIEKDKASIGMLQRMFKIGFNRAARIMDQLAEAGVVGPEEGTKPRKILMTQEEFQQYVDEYV